MREAMFIKKNADKWTQYQDVPTDNPDEMAERFVTLIDDLSYAKTFYPKSKVTRWINGIAAGIYQSIYQNKKEKYSRIFRFWNLELPLLFKKYHHIFLFTFCMFLTFVLIGVISSWQNEDFMRTVLGNDYVDMTEENIAKGDPFGVYKGEHLYSDNKPHYFSTFIFLAYHNIQVAFTMFIFGFTLGIFTTWALWKNGLMLGCFQYMFFTKGLGLQSVMVIWIHGTLEISAIVIAATSGYILANGILFPGTYSRWLSFRRGAKDAVKVIVSLVPVFFAAAFFESYVTHLMGNSYDQENNSGLPLWAGIAILAVSLSFIVWYFIIYPIRLHKKGYTIKPDGIIHRINTGNV
jgi:uncharacterized membrane protein SpoIIM required for sporulation